MPKESSSPQFPTTSWTLIKKVQKGSKEDAAKAMEEICRQYWYPIYAFARRNSIQPQDAEDLTQEVFANLITYDSISAVRSEKGKMRTFMLGAVKNVLSKRLRHDHAIKRGGGKPILSLDELSAESRYALEPADIHDPDAIFDHAWAKGVLASATNLLKAEYAKADNLNTFDQLCEFLPLGDHVTPYAAAAKKLGINEPTLRLQIHRMRKRYAALIEQVIAETVSDKATQKAELQYLLCVMGRP